MPWLEPRTSTPRHACLRGRGADVECISCGASSSSLSRKHLRAGSVAAPWGLGRTSCADRSRPVGVLFKPCPRCSVLVAIAVVATCERDDVIVFGNGNDAADAELEDHAVASALERVLVASVADLWW